MEKIITTAKLSGLHCPSCKKLIEKKLSHIPGVTRVEVDLTNSRAVIEAQTLITLNVIRDVLEGSDYSVISIN